MIQMSGSFVLNRKRRFGAAQGKDKAHITQMMKQVYPEFEQTLLDSYWVKGWGHKAYFAIDEEGEPGVWMTEGMGEKASKEYRKVV
ncbi:MAG: hypothetical protein ACTSW1_07485 [Candidatus Hodarchaeales archaeon]